MTQKANLRGKYYTATHLFDRKQCVLVYTQHKANPRRWVLALILNKTSARNYNPNLVDQVGSVPDDVDEVARHFWFSTRFVASEHIESRVNARLSDSALKNFNRLASKQ